MVLVSSDVSELLSQKAGQIHIDVEKINFEVYVRLYVYMDCYIRDFESWLKQLDDACMLSKG